MADINLGVGGANSAVAGGYEIENSLKFEADNSEYLKANNTFASTTPTSRQKGTVSFWIKRTEIGNGVSGKQMYIFASSDSSRYSNLGFDEFDNLTVFSGDSSWNSVSPYTYNKFRDTSAWYHIVIRYDTTDSTASNRLRVYSNGTEVSWVTAPNITQDGVMTYSGMNGPCWHSWGTIYSYFTPDKFFSGYLAEAHFVDGQSLAPTEFGEYDSTSGIWKPKAYDGTYGNCGYYLDFADSGNLGDDESGNGFDFDENNISASDQATDTPTNNFCTMNVLKGGINLSGTVYNRLPLMTEGATVVGNNSNNYTFAEATMGVTSGKWYWEMKPTVDANTLVSGAGIATNTNGSFSSTSGVGNFFYHYDGNRYVNGAATGYGAAWTTNDIIGFAYDADNWTLTCYINNSSQGNLLASQADLSAEFVIPYMYSYGTHTYQWNFGGYHANSLSSAASDANGYGTFEYAPPSGYYALCTKNLAEYG
jgi:hypothetical protein